MNGFIILETRLLNLLALIYEAHFAANVHKVNARASQLAIPRGAGVKNQLFAV
jgi:hypothetical protein